MTARRVPFEQALAAYKEAHAAYRATTHRDGAARTRDVKAFEDLQAARIRENRPWRPEDYR